MSVCRCVHVCALVLFAHCLYVIFAFGIVCCLCAIIKMLLYFLVPLFIFICKHALCLHLTHTHTRTDTLAYTLRICLFFWLYSWEIFGVLCFFLSRALLLLWIMRPLGATYFAYFIFFFVVHFLPRVMQSSLAANFKSGNGGKREEDKVLNIIKNIFGILGIPQIFKTHLKLDDIS